MPGSEGPSDSGSRDETGGNRRGDCGIGASGSDGCTSSVGVVG